MKMLVCPNCGGQITLDDSRDFGFCSYCGTKIQLNEVISVKHSGQINVEGWATVDSLVKKGFIQYDCGEDSKAEQTFETVMGIEPDNKYALIGKYLCSRNRSYWERLKDCSQDISEEEIKLMSEFNCSRINCMQMAYAYCCLDDIERISFIQKNYPGVIKLSFLNRQTCLNERIDMVEVLFNEGYDINEIMKEHFSLAYEPAGNYSSFYSVYFSPAVLEKYLSLGANVDLVSFDPSNNTEESINFLGFFSNFCQSDKSHYFKKESEFGRIKVDYTPEMYLEILKKYKKEDETVKSGGCYVATAVYGSYDCPPLWTLRRYRDFNLSKSWYGKLFIKIYYAVAPKAVDLFGEKKWFNVLLKNKIDKFVSFLKNKGYKDTPYEDMEW